MKSRRILTLLGWLLVVLSLVNGSAVVHAAGSTPVENAPNQPFQALVTVTIQPDNNAGAAQLPLPNGKRLVIEQVTAAGTVPLPATRLDFTIETKLKPAAVIHQLDGRRFEGLDLFKVSQQVRFYSEGFVGFIASYDQELKAEHSVDFTVSGYLVDILK
jgi:hypothetical protein